MTSRKLLVVKVVISDSLVEVSRTSPMLYCEKPVETGIIKKKDKSSFSRNQSFI